MTDKKQPDKTDTKPNRKTGKKQPRPLKWLFLVLLLAIIVGTLYWFLPTLQQKANLKPLLQTQTPVVLPSRPKTLDATEDTDKFKDLNRSLNDLSTRMTRLEQQNQGTSQQPSAQLRASTVASIGPLLSLVEQLEAKAQSAEPFAAELAAIKPQVPSLTSQTFPRLQRLEELATTGVPTRNQLIKDFHPRSGQSSPTSTQEAQPNKWLDKAKLWLEDLVSIRYTPPAKTQQAPQDPLIAPAHQLLTQGNLADILQYAPTLEEQGFAPWLTHLRNRLFVDQSILDLKIVAVSLLLLTPTSFESPEEVNE